MIFSHYKKHIRYLLFFSMITSIMFLVVLIFFRGLNYDSFIENRKLQQNVEFSFTRYIDGDFQDNVEHFLMDQIVLGETFKLEYQTLKTSFSVIFLDKLVNYFGCINNKYSSYGSMNHYRFNCENWIITKPETIDFVKAKNNLNKYEDNPNFQKEVDLYIYYITTSSTFSFEKNIDYNYHFFENYVLQSTTFRNIDRLKINNFMDYKQYFYKSDHHWNHIGSQQAYEDIIKMILGENEKIKKPLNEKCYSNFKFYGSRSRRMANFKISDEFCVYEYNQQNCKTTIDGDYKVYGNFEKYKKDLIKEYPRTTNHYANYHGSDYSEIIYECLAFKKKNLMIISDSFSNSINGLLANHFYKTHVIDLRYQNKEFNLNEYIIENDIDVVLLLSQANFFVSNEFEIE